MIECVSLSLMAAWWLVMLIYDQWNTLAFMYVLYGLTLIFWARSINKWQALHRETANMLYDSIRRCNQLESQHKSSLN